MTFLILKEDALIVSVVLRLKLVDNWTADKNIEIVVEYFSALEVSHGPVTQGDLELLQSARPHDVRIFNQEVPGRPIAEVFHSDASVRCHSVLLPEHPIDYLGIRVREVEDARGQVAGQAELSDQDEQL